MAGTKGRRGFGRSRKLPSGRWQAFYTDPGGRTTVSRSGNTTPVRHSAPHTFDTREDAEAWLTDERRLISSGVWTPPAARQAAGKVKALTFGEFAAAWLADRKVKGRPLADRTRDHYRDLLDRYILPTFEDVAVRDLTRDMVDRWYELVAIGKPTTRAHAYGLVRAILASAVDRDLIAVNPARVRGGGSTTRAKRIRPATTGGWRPSSPRCPSVAGSWSPSPPGPRSGSASSPSCAAGTSTPRTASSTSGAAWSGSR